VFDVHENASGTAKADRSNFVRTNVLPRTAVGTARLSRWSKSPNRWSSTAGIALAQLSLSSGPAVRSRSRARLARRSPAGGRSGHSTCRPRGDLQGELLVSVRTTWTCGQLPLSSALWFRSIGARSGGCRRSQRRRVLVRAGVGREGLGMRGWGREALVRSTQRRRGLPCRAPPSPRSSPHASRPPQHSTRPHKSRLTRMRAPHSGTTERPTSRFERNASELSSRR
jgi:hypothetical protein